MKIKILEHPYGDLNGGKWVRGNLHTHTTRSDGSRSVEAVLQDYRNRGYDFLMLSDHDIYTSAEQADGFDADGMMIIPGNEITANGVHLLHVNAGRHVAPHPQRQTILNEIATDENSFAIINHPNWGNNFNHARMWQLREWVGYIGIEIYNGVIGRLGGSSYCTDKWDMLLSEGRRVWGYANDDSHAPEDVELGWNHVYVKTNCRAEIVAALREGRCYPSNGVVIENITVKDLTIRIETQNAERIVARRNDGAHFAQVDTNIIEVEVPPDAKYARFECWGRGEKFAWTQPFYLKEVGE